MQPSLLDWTKEGAPYGQYGWWTLMGLDADTLHSFVET